jgi:hypothetical protein
LEKNGAWKELSVDRLNTSSKFYFQVILSAITLIADPGDLTQWANYGWNLWSL